MEELKIYLARLSIVSGDYDFGSYLIVKAHSADEASDKVDRFIEKENSSKSDTIILHEPFTQRLEFNGMDEISLSVAEVLVKWCYLEVI